MKKSKKYIYIALTFLMMMFISSCSFYTPEPSNKIPSSEGNTYVLNLPKVPSYDHVTEDNSASVVAGIVMPSTFEVSVYLKYQYTQQVFSIYYGYRDQVMTNEESSVATCFAINEDGYILTNAHVVTTENEKKYDKLEYVKREIKLNYVNSNVTFDAELISYDLALDLAILKVNPKNIENFSYVTLFELTDPESEEYQTDSRSELYYGETAIAIGNANGYGMSVTKGVISAPYRVFEDSGKLTKAIQTDAAINQGNSGGPLCNSYGAVIGINSFKIVTSTSESLGYAIPSYVITDYIDRVNTKLNLNIKYYTTTDRAYNNK